MGDGIDPELIYGVVSSILAFLIFWIKNSMDKETGELKERLSVVHANVDNINLNLNTMVQISAKQIQHVVQRNESFYRPKEYVKENEDVDVKEGYEGG